MKLALCLFHRNENRYLPEWFEHHRGCGVSHFYIYDNGSDSRVEEGPDVTVVDFAADQAIGKQMRAYFHCHSSHRQRHDWIGFLDTDEFIVGDLVGLLKRLRFGWLNPVVQVSISTRLYGSNGQEVEPSRQFGSYGRHWLPNDHVKSFVHCRTTMRHVPGDPHFFPCRGRSVNVRREPIDGPIAPHIDGPVVIDHYYTRSRQEWAEKCRRGRGDGCGHRTMEEFDAFNDQVTDHVKALVRPRADQPPA